MALLLKPGHMYKPALSFKQIAQLHAEHEDLFFLHQKALIDRDVDEAFGVLQKYETALHEHIDLEERWLLPAYAAYEKEGGEVLLFTGEHKRIKEFVHRFYEGLYAIKVAKTKILRDQELLKLLDHQALFKGLIEHHHRREEIYLFPTLDEKLSEAQKNKLMSAFL